MVEATNRTKGGRRHARWMIALTVPLVLAGVVVTQPEAVARGPASGPGVRTEASTRGVAGPYAVIHYERPAGDYGTPSANYNDFWGLHLWGDGVAVEDQTGWTEPKPFLGEDDFGRFAWIRRSTGDTISFVVHRGDTKDTNLDRSFDLDEVDEIWIREADPQIYTDQASAQGFVTIHYQRADGLYGDSTSPDYHDFWGLHLWGDALAAGVATSWTSPMPPSGQAAFGVYWFVPIDDPGAPLNFILHRGDTKDVPADETFVPRRRATVWRVSGDPRLHATEGAAVGGVRLHYHRPDADYGDKSSPDYNDYWGLHVFAGASTTSWTGPRKWVRTDSFGVVFELLLDAGADQLGYILHRGDTKDQSADQFLLFADHGHEVWKIAGPHPLDVDLPHYVQPLHGAIVFTDGFENGTTSRW